MAHPDARRPQATDLCAPEETIIKVVSEPLCSRERQSATQDTDKENDWAVDERMLGKLPDCSSYLSNMFPEFQPPYLHFSSPYKKGRLKMEFETVC